MRTLLLTVMVALPVVAMVVMGVLTWTYHRFRRIVPELRTQEDLVRLRSLAKLQMYLSLIAHPLLTIGGVFVVWIIGWLVVGKLGWIDLLLYGLGPIVLTFVVAVMGESPAEMAGTIPARDEGLAMERDRVVDAWINRLLPDW